MGAVNSISDKMLENQEKMMEKQKKTMIESQDRMIRLQMATQVAFSRDLVLWIGGAWSVLASGFVLGKIAKKNPPNFIIAPIFILGLVTAYQYDMAYGDKPNRIYEYRQDILKDNTYWFNPIVIEEEKEIKK
eukprot:TRINITY_DN11394_c0_g1_i1.p1 TRINITY_DN11394_c0_g1~~TRINITY_DN11394_c0_g1_i1.p1  ORF type:complete len:132 (-),score=26.88 TRINITY_DN11394_c0_g1_i1:35-430(-)